MSSHISYLDFQYPSHKGQLVFANGDVILLPQEGRLHVVHIKDGNIEVGERCAASAVGRLYSEEVVGHGFPIEGPCQADRT